MSLDSHMTESGEPSELSDGIQTPETAPRPIESVDLPFDFSLDPSWDDLIEEEHAERPSDVSNDHDSSHLLLDEVSVTMVEDAQFTQDLSESENAHPANVETQGVLDVTSDSKEACMPASDITFEPSSPSLVPVDPPSLVPMGPSQRTNEAPALLRRSPRVRKPVLKFTPIQQSDYPPRRRPQSSSASAGEVQATPESFQVSPSPKAPKQAPPQRHSVTQGLTDPSARLKSKTTTQKQKNEWNDAKRLTHREMIEYIRDHLGRLPDGPSTNHVDLTHGQPYLGDDKGTIEEDEIATTYRFGLLLQFEEAEKISYRGLVLGPIECRTTVVTPSGKRLRKSQRTLRVFFPSLMDEFFYTIPSIRKLLSQNKVRPLADGRLTNAEVTKVYKFVFERMSLSGDNSSTEGSYEDDQPSKTISTKPSATAPRARQRPKAPLNKAQSRPLTIPPIASSRENLITSSTNSMTTNVSISTSKDVSKNALENHAQDDSKSISESSEVNLKDQSTQPPGKTEAGRSKTAESSPQTLNREYITQTPTRPARPSRRSNDTKGDSSLSTNAPSSSKDISKESSFGDVFQENDLSTLPSNPARTNLAVAPCTLPFRKRNLPEPLSPGDLTYLPEGLASMVSQVTKIRAHPNDPKRLQYRVHFRPPPDVDDEEGKRSWVLLPSYRDVGLVCEAVKFQPDILNRCHRLLSAWELGDRDFPALTWRSDWDLGNPTDSEAGDISDVGEGTNNGTNTARNGMGSKGRIRTDDGLR